MMRLRLLLSCLAVLMVMGIHAQDQKKTIVPTMFQKNSTAMVHMKDGRTIKTPNANIFLKDASLLYYQGTKAKQARMDLISRVDIEEKVFINIENRLAYFVDSIKGNSLYCIETIDLDAFDRNLRNNVNYTHIDFNTDHLDSFTNDMNTEEDYVYPVVSEYYFMLDGKIVKAHDRELYRVLKKERYRLMKTAMSDPNFSWTSKESLMKMLDLISLSR